MKKRVLNKVIISLCAVLCLFAFASCSGDSGDKLSHMRLERPAGWQRVVKDRDLFKLGETEYTYTYSDGSSSEYYTYGTYPRIETKPHLKWLNAEFVWEFLDFDDDDTGTFLSAPNSMNTYRNVIEGYFKPEYADGSGWFLHSFISYTDPDTGYWSSVNYRYGDYPDLIIECDLPEEYLESAAEQNISLISKPVCYDAFVFFTHKNNPVDSLTVEQVRKIYSGEITNWREVGGKNKKIWPYQRETSSQNQIYMEQTVMQGKAMTEPVKGRDYDLFAGGYYEHVLEYRNANGSIGYCYKSDFERHYGKENVKVLKIDGVMPNDENTRLLNYAFTERYNAIFRSSELEGTGGKFTEWLLSDEGQKCVKNAKYVPIRPV